MRSADDPRLVACHREVMRETLDAHDRDLVARLGFERACQDSLADLVSDPVEWIHLASDAGGRVVGLVSGVVHPSGRAVVMFVGVGWEQTETRIDLVPLSPAPEPTAGTRRG